MTPGKLLSDPIEERFGYYRQLNGENFYISVMQLLLAEKKICCLCLLQQLALLAATNLGDHELATLDVSFASNSANNHVGLVEFLSSVLVDDDLPDAESAVAYFVRGYTARSILRRRKCVSCKDILIDATDTPDMNSCIPDEHKDIFEMASRGRLSAPSDYCFALITLANKYCHGK